VLPYLNINIRIELVQKLIYPCSSATATIKDFQRCVFIIGLAFGRERNDNGMSLEQLLLQNVVQALQSFTLTLRARQVSVMVSD
jgi:hypothetical protein